MNWPIIWILHIFNADLHTFYLYIYLIIYLFTYIDNGKNGKVGISVIFTSESPIPKSSIESTDDVTNNDHDDITDEEMSLQSRDSLTPQRNSFDKNLPRRARKS